MNIYQVSWINEEDNTRHEYFVNHQLAQQRRAQLSRIEKSRKVPDDPDEDDERIVKGVYEIQTIHCDISRTGILQMLNIYFNET